MILEDCLQIWRLNIPKNFDRKYGDGIVSPVELEDPTGMVLNMGLTESGGYIWLQDGWREFAKHYSLKLGQFVVYRSVGNEYPHRCGGNCRDCSFDGGFTEPKMEEGEEVINVEILHGFPRCQGVRQKSPCFFMIILEDFLREGKLSIPKNLLEYMEMVS